MDIPQDLVAQFVGVTNAPATLAAQLLRDSHLDLEAAITSFFAIQEAGGLHAAAADPPATPPAVIDVDADADANANADADADADADLDIAFEPVAPTSAPYPAPYPVPNYAAQAATAAARADAEADAALARALAETEAVARSAAAAIVRPPLPQIVDTLLPPGATAARRSVNFFDPFASSDGSARGDGLSALYKPPAHLNCSETFEMAMAIGRRQKRWLLVNIQRSDVFSSHVVNRDLWADPDIDTLLQEHFVFWQRDERSPEGARYKQFYRYAEPPHIALLDPRSGERLQTWGGDGEAVGRATLLPALQQFLMRHSLESDDAMPVAGTSASTRPAASFASARALNGGDVDMLESDHVSEDAELAAAIEASLNDKSAHALGGSSAQASSSGAARAPPGPVNRVEEDAVVSEAVEAEEVDRAASRLLSATDPTLSRNRSLRAQQDDEFEESLALDRAKEESQRAEALRVEREAQAEQSRARNAAEAREAKRRRVPPAPAPDCGEKITELVIRLPTGVRLQRRFLARENIGNVYDYIETECAELADVEFELMLAYPRKTFADREALLEELAPKAALVVHLKD